jgi:hypothetical protein
VWPSNGVAVQCLGVEYELAALGFGCRGRDRDLATKLIGLPGLALADAFDFVGMQRIDLVAVLAVVCKRRAATAAASG